MTINDANSEIKLEYWQCDHLEEYTGTKEQLQAIGFGCGLAFPGEPGGPNRGMPVFDAFGRKWSLGRQSRWAGDHWCRFFEVKRRRSAAETAAVQKANQARQALEKCTREPAQAINNATDSLKLARHFLAGMVVEDRSSAVRLPLSVRSRIKTVLEDMRDIKELIGECELEPNPAGFAQIEKLERTVALYSDPAFLRTLTPPAPRHRARRNAGPHKSDEETL